MRKYGLTVDSLTSAQVRLITLLPLAHTQPLLAPAATLWSGNVLRHGHTGTHYGCQATHKE